MTDPRALVDRLRRRRDGYGLLLQAGLDDVERQRSILEGIEALDREIAPVRERWDEVRGALEPSVRREIEDVVDETRRLLAELLRRRTEADSGPILARSAARAAYGG
jgi:predicted nuclease with TOPRIM domain